MKTAKTAMSLFVALFLLCTVSVSSAEGIIDSFVFVGSSADAMYADLQTALDEAQDGSILALEPGTYEATPSDFIDPMCGNCLDAATQVQASTGFEIRGKSVVILGSGLDTVLVTNAGYGIYVEDCPNVKIENLCITGGRRDQDGSATCAGVVVRRSSVEIAECEIRDNQGDFETTVAGIGGVMGREGAILNIHNNKIHDNSWDGVALYRGASAQIYDNEIWNGRGAGVGITWDSYANIIRNNVHDYWKGIGSFGNTRVGVFNNFVHDLSGWGIVATGTSDMICRNNTVIRCGNVGIAGWDETASIEITNNIIAFNGTVEQWVAPRVGIWMNCEPKNFSIRHNCIFGNYDAGVVFWYEEFEDGTWGYSYERDYDGVKGNIYVDPEVPGWDADVFPYEWANLGVGSPCINTGAPEILDGDASVSDMGATGGPYSDWWHNVARLNGVR